MVVIPSKVTQAVVLAAVCDRAFAFEIKFLKINGDNSDKSQK